MSLLGRCIEGDDRSWSGVLGSVGMLRILRPAFGAPISGPAKSVKILAFEASISGVLVLVAFRASKV
jgi:hypothetical protein